MHFHKFSLFSLASAATVLKRDGFSDGEPINDVTGKGAPIIGIGPCYLLDQIRITNLLHQGELTMNLTCKIRTTWDVRVLMPATFQT